MESNTSRMIVTVAALVRLVVFGKICCFGTFLWNYDALDGMTDCVEMSLLLKPNRATSESRTSRDTREAVESVRSFLGSNIERLVIVFSTKSA